jgi:DNA-binding GntR family transcriptional regulator
MPENRGLASKPGATQQSAPMTEDNFVLPEDSRIDRSSPIPDQVYRLLRQAIITLRMPPGSVIVEKQITDQLGISRTPVRDAIRQLADERLIHIRPQSGTYVALIDRHQLEEGRLIRRALEVEGIKLAVTHVDDTAIEKLRDLIALQERAAAKKRHDDFITYDDQFHQTISELSGFSRLWRIVNRSKAQLDRVRHLSSPLPHQEEKAIAQHTAVVEAMARHNVDRAVKALTFHLDDAYDRLSILLQQHAEMFE